MNSTEQTQKRSFVKSFLLSFFLATAMCSVGTQASTLLKSAFVVGVTTMFRSGEAQLPPLAPCFFTNQDLRNAVNDYTSGDPTRKDSAVASFGLIGEWCFFPVMDDMSSVFEGKASFNEDISGWDMSNIKNTSRMFSGAAAFNQPIEGWDMSDVEDATEMFSGAIAFNQNLCAWGPQLAANSATVTNMFAGASSCAPNPPNLADDPPGPFCAECTASPTESPTETPTQNTASPTVSPSEAPTAFPTRATDFPTELPTVSPSETPTQDTASPTVSPSETPTVFPTRATDFPTELPTVSPSETPTGLPTQATDFPTELPTGLPTQAPTYACVTQGAIHDAVDNYLAGGTQKNGVISLYGPIEGWCFDGVRDMSDLFRSLTTSLDFNLEEWNVAGVEDFTEMFGGVTFTTQPDFSEWNVSSGKNFSSMFIATNLIDGGLAAWDMSNAEYTNQMFSGARSFEGDISGWDLPSLKDARFMFYGASSFDKSLCAWGPQLAANDANVRDMFSTPNFETPMACPTILDPDLTADPPGPFCTGCACVTQNDLQGAVDGYISANVASRTNVREQYGDIENWCFDGVTDMNRLFLTDLFSELEFILERWNVSGVEDFSYMFSGSQFVTEPDFSGWDVSSGKNFSYMFSGTNLIDGGLAVWDMSNAEYTNQMFLDANFFNADISDWDLPSLKDADDMFSSADAFDKSLCAWGPQLAANDATVTNMFNGASACPNQQITPDLTADPPGPFCTGCACVTQDDLQGAVNDYIGPDITLRTNVRAQYGDIESWCFDNVTDMSRLFFVLSESPSFGGLAVNLERWNVAGVEDFSWMFAGIEFPTEPNFSNWDVSSGKDFSLMFAGTNLVDGGLAAWNMSNAEYTTSMFNSANNFNGDISGWDLPSLKDAGSMFMVQILLIKVFVRGAHSWQQMMLRSPICLMEHLLAQTNKQLRV